MKLNRRIIQVRQGRPIKEQEMGEVRIQVKLTNAADEAYARRGSIQPEEIRSLVVEALVDTGTARCVLPDEIRQRLGLAVVARRGVEYADGHWEEVDVSEPVRIEVEGRATYEDCLVLGNEILIGQTALESTDLFVDCLRGRLVPNPAHPNVVVIPVR